MRVLESFSIFIMFCSVRWQKKFKFFCKLIFFVHIPVMIIFLYVYKFSLYHFFLLFFVYFGRDAMNFPILLFAWPTFCARLLGIVGNRETLKILFYKWRTTSRNDSCYLYRCKHYWPRPSDQMGWPHKITGPSIFVCYNQNLLFLK